MAKKKGNIQEGSRGFKNHTYVSFEIKIGTQNINWINIEEVILMKDHGSENHVEKVIKKNRTCININEIILKKDHSSEKHVEKVIKINGRLKITI